MAATPFVRVELDRWRHGHAAVASSDGAAVAGVLLAGAAVVLDERALAGAAAVAVLAVLQTVAVAAVGVAAG